MSEQKEHPTEEWVYMGRRLLGDKLVQAFLRPDGELAHFSKLMRGGVIGGRYEAKVNTKGDVMQVIGVPEYRPPVIDGVRRHGADLHPETGGWAAKDRAASVADTVRRRENADEKASRDLGELTLNELAHINVRLPAPQSMALEVQVLARLRMTRAR